MVFMKIAIIENYANRAMHIEDLINAASVTYKMGNMKISTFRIHEKAEFPDPEKYDSIILSGGACGVYEKEQYPYIVPAIDYVRSVADRNIGMLGICFGHQLIAEALGGIVANTGINDIGWKKIVQVPKKNQKDIRGTLNQCMSGPGLLDGLPDMFYCFEYHKDQAITLPENTRGLAFSANCGTEAFQYADKRIFGVQFHPEISAEKATVVYQNQIEKLRSLGLDAGELAREAHERYDKKISERIIYNFLTM
jgi:GMP synthase-like glutamine amidotransferase